MPAKNPKQVIVHPILFAIFPPLFLVGQNTIFVDFSDAIGPVVFCCLAGLSLWLLVWRCVRDIRWSGIVTSVFLFVFYSFGAIQDVVVQISSSDDLGNVSIANRVLLGSLSAVFGACILCVKFRNRSHEISYLFNLVSTLLVSVSMVSAVAAAYERRAARELLPDRTHFNQPVAAAPPGQAPDIYYIILDGYGRADFLAEEFGFDNSEFIGLLGNAGFYIANESRANYPQTLLSLSSSLNFSYLDELFGEKLTGLNDRSLMREVLRNNRTVSFLRDAGYTIVSIAGLYDDADIRDTDVHIKKWWMLNSFETNVLAMTPIPWLLHYSGKPILYDLHRMNLLHSFDELPRVVELPGPKFVYVHIFAAHPPFVFGRDGEPTSRAARYQWDDGEKLIQDREEARQEYIEAYIAQLQYINGKVMGAARGILEVSASPPVIVIQGDHGPGTRFSVKDLEKTDVRERFSILNAYYMPDGGDEVLYESISPVNSFRAVFNRYLGTNLEMLEDCSFFNPWFEPYNFIRVSCQPSKSTELAAGEVGVR